MAVIPYPPSAICYSHFVACNLLPVGFYMCSVYKHFLLRETWKYNIRGSFVCPFRQDPLTELKTQKFSEHATGQRSHLLA